MYSYCPELARIYYWKKKLPSDHDTDTLTFHKFPVILLHTSCRAALSCIIACMWEVQVWSAAELRSGPSALTACTSAAELDSALFRILEFLYSNVRFRNLVRIYLNIRIIVSALQKSRSSCSKKCFTDILERVNTQNGPVAFLLLLERFRQTLSSDFTN